MQVIIFLCGIVCTILASPIPDDTDASTLVLAHVVFRHGDRTPDEMFSFPTDQHANETYFPYGKGALTKAGKIRALHLGELLKNRYGRFLGTTFFPALIEAIASGVSRCRMSMELVLATLFPPDSSDVLEEGLNWQPVVYDYKDVNQDLFIATYKSCPEIMKAQQTKIDNVTQFVFDYLTEFSGMPIKSSMAVLGIQDIIKTQSEWGFERPTWVNQIWPEPITTVAMQAFQNIIDDKKRLTYAAGSLIQKIITDSIDKSTDESMKDRKLYLYAGHDYNINMLLGILGFRLSESAEYTSHLMFELHKIKDEYIMKVYFQNYDGPMPELLDIPGCGQLCPLKKFHDLHSKYYPMDWCSF